MKITLLPLALLTLILSNITFLPLVMAASNPPLGTQLMFDNIEPFLPDQVTISVVVPGAPDCYVDVTIDEDSFLDGAYCGWCIDSDHGISSPETYLADVYSSYEAAAASFVEYPENLDLVNWIMNQGWVGQTSGGGYGTYTYGDVQRAIWALLDDEQGSTAALGPFDDDRVNEIIADALANGEGFEPGYGELTGIMLIPLDGEGNYYVQYLMIGIESISGFGKVTGGGQIGVGAGEKDVGSFGFNAMWFSRDDGPKGELQYLNHVTGDLVHAHIVDYLIVWEPLAGNKPMPLKKAYFYGPCTINHEEGYWFSVYVEDDGEPKNPDKFEIKVFDNDQLDNPLWTNTNDLLHGNIQIHKPPK